MRKTANDDITCLRCLRYVALPTICVNVWTGIPVDLKRQFITEYGQQLSGPGDEYADSNMEFESCIEKIIVHEDFDLRGTY